MHGRLSIALAGAGLVGFVACTATDEDLAASDGQNLSGEVSIWDTTAAPARADVADNAAVELGVRFKTDVAGSLTGIRYFKSRANSGQHTAHLWSTDGRLLASATFTGETATGWQTVRFASPVALRAGGTYVASYHTDVGHYAGDNGFFRGRGVDRAPLHALADGTSGGNGVYRYGGVAFPSQSFQSTNYWVDVLFAPAATAPVDAGTPPIDGGSPASDSGGPPVVDAGSPPTGACVGAANTPGGSDGMGGCFPGAHNTGVPAGITLTAYTGSCTITTANTVIDGKTVNCSLSIRATGVTIKNSRINGTVSGSDTGSSFTITDSEVAMGRADANGATGIGESNFTAVRVEVTGGNRSIYCRKNCTVRDSWVHGQSIIQEVRLHASGIRQSQGATLIHNTITCDTPDTPSGGGCSAGLTGYGDFEPVIDNRLEKNLFAASTGGACAYGGSSGDDGSKPYGAQASNIVFTGNVFQRGRNGKCGAFFPITDFDSSRPGNSWTNNRWDDGANLPPAN